jgi:hypothetical protein
MTRAIQTGGGFCNNVAHQYDQRMSRQSASFNLVSAATGTGAILLIGCIGAAAIVLLPPYIVSMSGIDMASLTQADNLSALRDARSSVVALLAGLSAVGVAYAALWQANGARIARSDQFSINWSESYSKAVARLEEASPTTRFSGVVALCALSDGGSVDRRRTVGGTLSSFIRTNRRDRDDASVLFALSKVVHSKMDSRADLAGADLSNLDLSPFDFKDCEITGASFRGTTLSTTQKPCLESVSNLDLGNVIWRG